MENPTLESEDPGGSEQGTTMDFRRVGDKLGLQSSRTSKRLNQIDRVRANGVGDHVALPQLVVCGDQSAGKSSVLEGISGIPFPRQDGLCTRFATEIVMRHTPDEHRMTATIIPHFSREGEERQRLASFRKEFLDFAELPGIIEAAGTSMGIRTSEDQTESPTFAADVLRLELVGNTGLHLTIVDLPGLISVSENEHDVQLVSGLVNSYLESSRTIVLAVVPASSDVDTQGIIQRARRYDTDGLRTVGIVTKPDLINAGTEKRVARLAKNMDRTKLNLGFFLLKNPAPAELREGLSPDARKHTEQTFFSSAPWNSLGLDPSRVGIENLRVFLQDLLDSHIERELPKVREELRELLERNSQTLAALGTERKATSEIRIYLTQISTDFHSLVQAGIDGDYGGRYRSFFDIQDSKSANRLRAVVHLENEKFANHIREYGNTRKVVSQKDDQNSKPASSKSQPTSYNKKVEVSSNKEGQILISQEELAAWVKQVYHSTRGKELPGNYNHALLAELFHSQSKRWGQIARGHVNAVASLASRFLEEALKFVIRDIKVRQNIQSCVEKSLQENIKRAIVELNVLLEDEARQPITYNHYYTDNVQKARNEQSKRQIRDSMQNTLHTDQHGRHYVSNSPASIEKLVTVFQERVVVDMTDQACSEAQNDLSAYYKTAMKTFVDNVSRQVIERHIIAKLPKVFEPVLVSGYDTAKLRQMGAESAQVSLRRDEARHLQEALERSLDELGV